MEDIRFWFMEGIDDFDYGDSIQDVEYWIKELRYSGFPLCAQAYYDGYIRRKHGLVDENGEEIFR